MKSLFYIEQNKKFPEVINVVVVANKGLSAIPVYNYDGSSVLIFTKGEHVYTPFYVGAIPRTYGEEYVIPIFIYTNYNLPLFSVIEAKPLYYVKFVEERVYNIIVGTLAKEDYPLSKERVKKDIFELFNVSRESFIIESEYKAKAYLINSNRFFEREFIVLKRE